MLKFIKNICFGKKHTKEYDLEVVKAHVVDDNGEIYTFTRTGQFYDYGDLGHAFTNGSELLEHYISTSKLQILIDDNGKMLPVCKINKITKIVESKLITHSWRG